MFEFQNETSKEKKLFFATDTSTNTVRYNKFEITLTGSTIDENLTNGVVYLAPDGKWNYNIHQMNLLKLNTNDSQGIIERGIVKVSGTNLSDISYLYDGLSGQTYNYLQ